MRPQLPSSMPGRAMKLSRAAAVRLTAIAVAHCCASMAGLGPSGQTTPALLISTCTGPQRCPIAASAPATWSGSATSAGRPSAWPPRPVIARRSGDLAAERASTATCAPCSASPRLMACPMPRPPPVTRAIRFVSVSFIVSTPRLAAGPGRVLPARSRVPEPALVGSVGVAPIDAPAAGCGAAGGALAAGPGAGRDARNDETAQWLVALGGAGPVRELALARLHGLLLRIARAELARRAGRHPVTGPELDDLAHQSADDALLAVMAKLGQFRGDSRFTTWAYRFVVLEVSGKLGRHFGSVLPSSWTPRAGTGCRTGSGSARRTTPSGRSCSPRCAGRCRRS